MEDTRSPRLRKHKAGTYRPMVTDLVSLVVVALALKQLGPVFESESLEAGAAYRPEYSACTVHIRPL